MSKSSKIVKCKFTSEWNAPPPANTTLYYHELTLENGDIGNVATKEKYSDKIKEGVVIKYDIDEKKKIKLIQEESTERAESHSHGKQPFVKKRVTTPDTYLGYAYAYAKDMVVAGKTTKKDRENLETIATEIYEAIKKKLKTDEAPK